jgi:hypothetical protein
MREKDLRKLDHKTLEEIRTRTVRQVQAGESPEVVVRAPSSVEPASELSKSRANLRSARGAHSSNAAGAGEARASAEPKGFFSRPWAAPPP